MPSQALGIWQNQRFRELDEIQYAHYSVGGGGRGRRFATQQVNNSYLMLLSAQFQGFCRDLHSECVDHLLIQITPLRLQQALREACTASLVLDKGNPNEYNIKKDFSRLSFDLTPVFKSGRSKRLTMLNCWRNAIAHQDFDQTKLNGQTKLRLAQVRVFRSLCNRLAKMMDKCAQPHIHAITGQHPWP